MKCGTYKVTGVLELSKQNYFILRLNRRSTFPIEFLVIGSSVDKKMKFLNQFVTAHIYVPELIAGSLGNNVVFLQSIESSAPIHPQTVKLIKIEKCGLGDKFIR